MPTFRFARCVFLPIVFLLGLTVAAAADDNRVYFSSGSEPRLPDCTAGSIQGAVARSVARAQKSYFHGRRILGLDNIRQAAYQVNGVSPVARRYCQGKASLSDGTIRPVYYMIEEHAGLFGIGWNVETCLAPLDKWHVYGAWCSTARPR